MTRFDLEMLLRLGGLVQLGIAASSLAVPHLLEWPRRLACLDPFTRRLFWVYAAFILLVNVGFGLILLLEPGALASGGALGRLVCGFIAVFWICRLVVQFFAFEVPPEVDGMVAKLGYHGLTLGFSYLALVCGWAALQ
jgi:hypothetical protein